MKTINKLRVAISSIAIMPLVIGVMVGVATPAIAPSKADAQMIVLKKYTNATSLTDKQLVELLKAIGFEGKALQYAWAIAMKESHGRPLSFNGNHKTGDSSFGLFQVNMIGALGPQRRAKFGLASNAELLNPVTNAQVAYYMSGRGKDWSAWKGTKQESVQYWLTKYPYKTPTQAHKAKAKAIEQAMAKPKQKH